MASLRIVISGYPDDLKTELVEKYSGEKITEISSGNPTITNKEIYISKNIFVRLTLINILESPTIDFYRPEYYRRADGVVFTYQKESYRHFFDDIKRFYEIFRNNTSYNAKFVLIAFKKDLSSKDIISTLEGQKLAEEMGADYYNIHEINYTIIDTIFSTMVRKILEKSLQEFENKMIVNVSRYYYIRLYIFKIKIVINSFLLSSYTPNNLSSFYWSN